MSKKIKYGILIVLIIVLAVAAYFVIAKKLAKNDLGKTKNTAVVLTKEQAIENANKEAEVREEARKAEIQQTIADVDQMVKEDLARRAREAAPPVIVTSSPELNNIKPVK